MFLHAATADEVDTLRAVFGPTVEQVTFWDAEFPADEGGQFVLAEPFATDGGTLPLLRHTDPGWEPLREVLAARGETVKFGLTIR